MSPRKTLLFPLLLALVPSLVYWEVFTGDVLSPLDWVYRDMKPWSELDRSENVVNTRIKDAMLISHSLDAVSARAASEGDVLLWNRFAGGGMPHVATGFTRMLYPLFWIHAVLPPIAARNAEVLLHLFLASWFAFAFLRRVHCNPEGAFLGGVIFGLTPSIVHRAEMSFHLPSLIWLPLLLYFIEAIATTGKLVFAVGLAIAVALQINAGYFPDILVNCLGAAAYGVVRLVMVSRGSLRTTLVRSSLCVTGVALGVALAAPFLLTSLDLISVANRPVTTTSELAETGLGWKAFATLLTPWISRSTLFVGLVPLLFVPLAFRNGTRPVAWALLAVVVTGLAIGAGTPILAVLQAVVPPVRNLNYVHTLISVGAFGVALLAGIGLSQFFRRSSPLAVHGGWGMLGLAAASSLVIWLRFPELWERFQVPVALATVVLLVLALQFHERRSPPKSVTAIVLLVPILLELSAYARAVNPRTDPERFPPFPEFGSVRFLLEDGDLFRVGPLPRQQAPFWPNTLGAYGIEDVGAYQSIVPRALGEYMDRLHRYAGGRKPLDVLSEEASPGNWISLPEYRPSHLLRIWNLKYVVLPKSWENPDPSTLELAYDDEVRIYRLKNWLSRAWLADGATVLPDERSVYGLLLDPTFNPERTVVLEHEPACSFVPARRPIPRTTEPVVELASYDAERLVLRTSSPRPAYLFLSQSYDPGWKAEVDERTVPILRANANFQALALGAGSHEVTLRYQPDAYTWGWIAFAMGAVVCVFFGLPRWHPEARLPSLPVVLSLVPIGIAVAGWQDARDENEARTCDQLQVAARPAFPDEGEAVSLSNGIASAHEIRAPGAWRWTVRSEEPSMFRFRLGRFDRARTGNVTWTARLPEENAPPLATGNVPARSRRWHRFEVPLPPGTSDLELRTSTSTSVTTSVALAAPAVLAPRPRIASVVVFQLGSSGDESSLADFGDARWKVLLKLGDVPRNLTARFDEVYASENGSELSRRLLALAPELYRVATVVVVNVGPGAAERDIGERQVELLRAELDRLGLTEDDVEIRVVDR